MFTRRHVFKLIAFWAGFLILHYAYDFFPILPLKLISGVDESFFQHAKIGFFGYALVNLGEYLIRRRGLKDVAGFVYTRLFTTTVLPWFIFLIWFTAPAYYGPIASVAVEIIFANVALVLATNAILIVEETMAGIAYPRPFKVLVGVLFLVSISLFVIFTFGPPWCDVFADPYGGGGQLLSITGA